MAISFCTPVVKPNACFMNAVEKYNWFGSEVVYIVSDSQANQIGRKVHDPSSCLEKVIKLSSMIFSLGLLPLAALIIKLCSRCCQKSVILQSANSNHQASSPSLLPVYEFVEDVKAMVYEDQATNLANIREMEAALIRARQDKPCDTERHTTIETVLTSCRELALKYEKVLFESSIN